MASLTPDAKVTDVWKIGTYVQTKEKNQQPQKTLQNRPSFSRVGEEGDDNNIRRNVTTLARNLTKLGDVMSALKGP